MKERLEEINNLLRSYYGVEDLFEQTDLAIDIIQGHIGWLYQQAERVEELEKAGEFFESGYRQYEEENNRYKKAFKIINNAFNNDQVDNELFIAEVEDVLVSLKQKGLLTDGF